MSFLLRIESGDLEINDDFNVLSSYPALREFSKPGRKDFYIEWRKRLSIYIKADLMVTCDI